MRGTRQLLPASLLLAICAAVAAAQLPVSAQTAAQVRISALGLRLEPQQESTSVRLSRFADLTEVESVAVGTELAPDDLLTGLDEDLFVELRCTGGSLLRFTGKFRVLVRAAGDGVDCAVNLLAGKLDLLTDERTEVNSAGQVLGTEGTRYALRLQRTPAGPEQRVLVFEGKVEVGEPRRQREWVAGGLTVTLLPEGPTAPPQAITAEEVDRWARLYARFDVIKAQAAGAELGAEGSQAAAARLAPLHAAVLRQPDDPQARAELVEAQVTYRVADEARYNLERFAVDAGARELYQLDRRRLYRGDELELPQVKEFMRRAVTPRPPSGSPESGGPGAERPEEAPVALEGRAEELLRRGEYREVVQVLEAELPSGGLTSRSYLALAQAYRALGEAERGRLYAERALRLDAREGGLSAREKALCERLTQAPP
jgi:hypothetical protein